MALIVLFAVHLEHQNDGFLVDEKPFSIVQGYSLFNLEINQDLFVVSLIVHLVGYRFDYLSLFEKL